VADPSEDQPVDLGVITHTCICGCTQWKIWASFEDFEISAYSLEMYCLECGAKAITPTPIDRPQ
jgi:hypothetical protein